VRVIGRGSQRCAPVCVGHVARVLMRGTLDLSAPAGTYALAGPDVLTVDEFVGVVSGGRVRERHLQGRLARALAHFLPRLTPALVEVMDADSLPDTTLSADGCGLNLHSIRDVYQLAPARA